jgi:periplasmic divalent cation tolerance protein
MTDMARVGQSSFSAVYTAGKPAKVRLSAVMIIVYITCASAAEAKKIGRVLVKKRLAACSIVIPGALSFYRWPPKKNKIERSIEAILLVKTLKKKFSAVGQEVKKIHSYTVPCIFSIPIERANAAYLRWLGTELK